MKIAPETHKLRSNCKLAEAVLRCKIPSLSVTPADFETLISSFYKPFQK